MSYHNTLEFDKDKAIAARDEGIEKVASNNAEFLVAARAVAKELCVKNGDVTSDDVRKVCPVLPTHFNAYGAVFKTPDFTFTGEYRMSTLVQGHGNMQRVWRLKDRQLRLI